MRDRVHAQAERTRKKARVKQNPNKAPSLAACGARAKSHLQLHAFTQEDFRTNYSRYFVQIRKSRISKASQGRARKKAGSKHKKFCGELNGWLLTDTTGDKFSSFRLHVQARRLNIAVTMLPLSESLCCGNLRFSCVRCTSATQTLDCCRTFDNSR